MKCRLLCIDLDGTLLTDEKRIREQDAAAIRKAVQQGIKVALVTGRMPAATVPIARRLDVPCILACNAGTYILKGEQCIWAEYLPAEAMTGIYESIRPFGIPLWIFRDRQWFVTAKDEFVDEEEKLIHYQAEIADVYMLAAEWEKNRTGPNKVLIGAEPALVQKVYDSLKSRQDVDMACSSENYLEIFPKGMNKGKALRLICEKEGVRKEETMAFGDQELDLPMLEEAGIAVAMGNGIEEAKQKADFVTKSNNEAGIAYALEHFGKIQEKQEETEIRMEDLYG